MYGLVLSFLLLVLFKVINNNCIFIFVFFIIFFSMIYYQLIDFKKKANDAFCPICKTGTICKLLCESNLSAKIVSVIIAMIASFSMMSFIYTVSSWFLLVILLDMIIFYFIYNSIDHKLSKEFKENALGFFKEISINFLSILFLLGFFIMISLISVNPDLQLSPQLFEKVNQDINHGCLYFQHFVRTTYFFDLFIQSLMNLDGVSGLVFSFLYITSLSLFPFFAITLVFKFSYNWIDPKVSSYINKLTKKIKEIKDKYENKK